MLAVILAAASLMMDRALGSRAADQSGKKTIAEGALPREAGRGLGGVVMMGAADAGVAGAGAVVAAGAGAGAAGCSAACAMERAEKIIKVERMARVPGIFITWLHMMILGNWILEWKCGVGMGF